MARRGSGLSTAPQGIAQLRPKAQSADAAAPSRRRLRLFDQAEPDAGEQPLAERLRVCDLLVDLLHQLLIIALLGEQAAMMQLIETGGEMLELGPIVERHRQAVTV
jgi:hypothetical protein